MAKITRSDGTEMEVPDVEVWGPPKTQAQLDAEKEEELQRILEGMTDAGTDRDKALAWLMADMWRAANPGLTVKQARAAVKDRLLVHLREIKNDD